MSIRENISTLHRLSEAVAILDLLMSFAHYCTISTHGSDST